MDVRFIAYNKNPDNINTGESEATPLSPPGQHTQVGVHAANAPPGHPPAWRASVPVLNVSRRVARKCCREGPLTKLVPTLPLRKQVQQGLPADDSHTHGRHAWPAACTMQLIRGLRVQPPYE